MTSTDGLRLYTLSEAAERLLVSEDWLLKRARARRLPARKSGRDWTFSDDDIRAAIETMKAPGAPETLTEATEVSRGGAR